ncbi:hypothetical protein AcW2_005620 [Taiwanofungus camphoratus]|nr:hypothetical protein AcW2_005620 [Antrodia cinnamomea]
MCVSFIAEGDGGAGTGQWEVEGGMGSGAGDAGASGEEGASGGGEEGASSRGEEGAGSGGEEGADGGGKEGASSGGGMPHCAAVGVVRMPHHLHHQLHPSNPSSECQVLLLQLFNTRRPPTTIHHPGIRKRIGEVGNMQGWGWILDENVGMIYLASICVR